MRAVDALAHDRPRLRAGRSARRTRQCARSRVSVARRGIRELLESHWEVTDERLRTGGRAVVASRLDANPMMLDGLCPDSETPRCPTEALEPSAECELNGRWAKRNHRARRARAGREAEAARGRARKSRGYSQKSHALEPIVLGQLTEQLCPFDEQTASGWPRIDTARAVIARCSHATPRLCHHHRKSRDERRSFHGRSPMIASIALYLARFGTGQNPFAIA
jgi:hypothetical protein